ncbi:hypothetical protein I4U23_021513 [Adineta vaga]|nr:hypothetical protein I4U23_021513 [Adineta vaga]
MSPRTQLNHRSLAFIVLITGILGGLLIVFSILLLCKYCLNRRSLREAEQMKLLYETLNQASLIDANRLYKGAFRESSPLEPRRSNPLDRYLLQENQWQIPSSKQIPSDYHLSGGQTTHNQSYHSSREYLGNKSYESNIVIDDEQAYLQVDPRCYVRQNSNINLLAQRKSDTPRLEKGHSLNVDTRPSPSSTSLSPYRQSSFDVTLAYRSQQHPSTPTSLASTQPDIYYTPRGSSLSVVGNPLSNTPTSSQHLSPLTPTASRKNSIALIIEKKDLTATLDTFGNQPSTVRSSVVQREHEHSRSLEYSSPPVQQHSPTNCSANDKQSRSFDAVHLLRPGVNRSDVVNRRTKSYECADDRRPSTSSIAPAPIVIKIPDMTELVHAAKLSCIQSRRESTNMEDYQNNKGRKETLVQQFSNNDHENDVEAAACTASKDLWRLRQSYELEEQQRLGQTSPEDFSPDLLTSTSIDSAGAMPIHHLNNHNSLNNNDDDLLKYQHRRKSSSNLLLPPPEVRRQALRRTCEKRRSCINQSNARREQQLLNNLTGLDDENLRNPLTKFSSLLHNFNSKSENSSFERSLETDFDMQSDTSSRGPNDQFTSIESSGNENALPDVNNRFITNRRQQPPQQSSPQISPQQDDSGYKSLESQNSQNRTISLDWMSTDGGESVIYVGDSRIQQRSVDVKDLDEDLAEQQQQQNLLNHNRRSPKLLHTGLQHSYQESSKNLILPNSSHSPMMQHRSLSTNIPFVDHSKPSPINLSVTSYLNPMNSSTNNSNKLTTSTSFIRTASKKRREFGKDKKHAQSNVGFSSLTNDEHQTNVHQINETNMKSSSLHVRHPDLRRTRSDGSRNLPQNHEVDSSTNESTANTNSRLSSSADGLPVSHSSPHPIRQHLSPNITDIQNSRHILQRSPSSTTSPVTLTPHVEAFRSQRGSLSFDTHAPSNTSSSPTKIKAPPTTYSIFPTCITKPRFKFSMVRDSAMASFGHSTPVYSMPITRDYSIDKKTNRIVNEFLMHDPTLDGKKNILDESSHRVTPKRHHHRIRPKTFDETTTTTSPKQSRSTVNKQRHQNSPQTNIRKHSQYHYPSVHLSDNVEQGEKVEEEEEEDDDDDDGEEEDSSDPATPALLSHQQSIATTRRDISMASGSPSIIITGDDSGS